MKTPEEFVGTGRRHPQKDASSADLKHAVARKNEVKRYNIVTQVKNEQTMQCNACWMK